MRLWLNRTGEVSLREQLITQVVLGILCQELLPGQRLPSTRELARRFGIHANTASAAYRNWSARAGSNSATAAAFMCAAARRAALAELAAEFAVDQLIGELVAKGAQAGRAGIAARPAAPLAGAHAALALAGDRAGPGAAPHRHPRDGAGAGAAGGRMRAGRLRRARLLEGSMPVTVPSKAALVRKLLPPGTELTVLQVHPVSLELMAHLQRYLPEHAGELVGIASRWKEFQRIAQTMLVAAGLVRRRACWCATQRSPAGSAAWMQPPAWSAMRSPRWSCPRASSRCASRCSTLNVDRLIFTHIHTYILTDKATGIVLASGRVRAFDGVVASSPMAEQIVKALSVARLPSSPVGSDQGF
jgi:DNA-binding transcriptional regulator YhcF (GntR family)